MSISYSDILKIPTFEERVQALFLKGKVGFIKDQDRAFMQSFYHTDEWKWFVNEIRIRDNGYDLACPDRPIRGLIIIHHIEPITLKDIANHSRKLLDPENVISVSDLTHKAIHYGDYKYILTRTIPERKPNDTIPWR